MDRIVLDDVLRKLPSAFRPTRTPSCFPPQAPLPQNRDITILCLYGREVNTCFQLPNCHDVIFDFLFSF